MDPLFDKLSETSRSNGWKAARDFFRAGFLQLSHLSIDHLECRVASESERLQRELYDVIEAYHRTLHGARIVACLDGYVGARFLDFVVAPSASNGAMPHPEDLKFANGVGSQVVGLVSSVRLLSDRSGGTHVSRTSFDHLICVCASAARIKDLVPGLGKEELMSFLLSEGALHPCASERLGAILSEVFTGECQPDAEAAHGLRLSL